MAQSFGSVAHPVDLGPFSRITEVHWTSEKYFALLWTPRGRSTSVDQSEGCSPVEYGPPFSGYPLPPHPWGITYLTEVEYYLPPGSPQGVSDMVVRRGNGWHGLAAEPVITGLPTLPPVSTHGSWQQAWLLVGDTSFVTDTDGATRHAEHDLAASFRLDSGTNTDIDLPDGAPGFFQTGFTPVFGFSSPAFLSADPICMIDGGGATARMFSETPDWIDTVPVPLASVVVTYKDKTYRGMAAKPLQTIHGGQSIALGLWILCEREDSTS